MRAASTHQGNRRRRRDTALAYRDPVPDEAPVTLRRSPQRHDHHQRLPKTIRERAAQQSTQARPGAPEPRPSRHRGRDRHELAPARREPRAWRTHRGPVRTARITPRPNGTFTRVAVTDGVDAPLPTASRCARKQTHAVCVQGIRGASMDNVSIIGHRHFEEQFPSARSHGGRGEPVLRKQALAGEGAGVPRFAAARAWW